MARAERTDRGARWAAVVACVFVCGACAGAKNEGVAAPAAAAPAAVTPSPATVALPPCDPAEPVAMADAKLIVMKRCASCHSPSGTAGDDYDWTKDDALVAHRRNVAAQLAGDTMPPSGYPRPTPEERHTLMCWAKGDTK